jgi:REP element-mobilizing transposase RayT
MDRKSIRLKGYDYSQEGFYFITISVNYKLCLFGEIENGNMILNSAGKMVDEWYYELENKFKNIKCQEKIIMPNHFHCIIQIVGADLCVCPNVNVDVNKGVHIGTPLPSVIQWFKTMTTNSYIKGVNHNDWERFNKKLWQRNYWEHIIRNEKEYQNIADYIIDNPNRWDNDKLYFTE